MEMKTSLFDLLHSSRFACLLVFTRIAVLAPASSHAQPTPSPKAAAAPVPAPAKTVKGAPVINEHHPILCDFGLLGGSENGNFLTINEGDVTYKGKPIPQDYSGPPIQVDLPMVRGGETYRLYSLKKFLGTGTGSKVSYKVDGAANAYYRVEFKTAEEVGEWRFAINGNWDALPRTLKVVKPGRTYAVDVDGDGIDETIQVRTEQKKPGKGSDRK